MALEAQQHDTLSKTALVAGEFFVPGASELIAGDIGSGVGHFLFAGLAAAVFLPSMPIVATLAAIGVRANSYHKALYGTDVWSRAVADFSDSGQRPKAPVAKGA